MASAVATPLERQFSTIAGLDSMSSMNALGITADHAAVQPRSRHRRRRPGRAGGHRQDGARQLPPSMPTPPSYQKVNPADQPILYLALNSPTLPLSAVDEYARDPDRAADLDGQRRGPGAGLRLAEVRRARPARPATLVASRGIGIDEVVGRGRSRATSTCPPARSTAGSRPSPSRRTASSPRPPPTGPLIVAYRNGSPVRLEELGARHRQRRERQDRHLVQRRPRGRSSWPIQRQPGTNTVAGGRRDQGRSCPTFRAQMPASVEPRRPLRPLASRSATRCSDVKFTLLLTLVPRRPGDLPLPAQPLGHHDPEPRAAHVDRRAPSRSCTCSATASTTSR